MNTDDIEGAARGVVGKAQRAYGEVTNDVGHQASGTARELAGRAQEVYGEAKDAAQGAARQVGRVVEKQPVLSLLVAGAIGYGLALLTVSATTERSWRRW
ncbi:CsbD family protein [Paracraurococcus ruber]|uniref:CsbD-like domain-containing protein n=1 Tax=Paracraurococcus ruber TaxID=77675 RepID=A0ABS1CW03_9PROT|nr:CsbD family protein [Paracraurococcus ruber]MBK1658558.1 hypothetical protein [Paracraurococcus ruber]TDG30888.1 CsbD family protein [Paracraurococcus ruber]